MSFDSLRNGIEIFELTEEPHNVCIFAQKFSTWTEECLARSTPDPSIVFVNQAKVLLVDKYFEWRSVVPKSHRNRLGNGGHRCIFQVFEQAYQRLKAIELALTPPLLFLPPPASSPPPMPQIAGIFIGELDKPLG